MDAHKYSEWVNRVSATATAQSRLLPVAIGQGILGVSAFSAAYLEFIYAHVALQTVLRDENGQLSVGDSSIAWYGALVFVIVSVGWFHIGLKRTVERGVPFRLFPYILGLIVLVTFAQAALVALSDLPRGGTGPRDAGNGLLPFLLNTSALVRCIFIVMAGLTAAYGFNMILNAIRKGWIALKRRSDGQVLSQNSENLNALHGLVRPNFESLTLDNVDHYVAACNAKFVGHAREIDLVLLGKPRTDNASLIADEISKSAPFKPQIPIEIEVIAERAFQPHKLDLDLLPSTFSAFTPRMRAALADHANWLRTQARTDIIKDAL
ncbi:unnamed protein product [Ectocarpus sp. 8 AP-2014]